MDKKNVDYKTKFSVPDGVIQRSFCPICGKLSSGDAVGYQSYGWFDENNLPGYCGGGHADFTREKNDGDKNNNKKNETTKANSSSSSSTATTSAGTNNAE